MRVEIEIHKSSSYHAFNIYVPLSGVGTHVSGYVGHGDAKWEEQVLQGVEMIKVFSMHNLI